MELYCGKGHNARCKKIVYNSCVILIILDGLLLRMMLFYWVVKGDNASIDLRIIDAINWRFDFAYGISFFAAICYTLMVNMPKTCILLRKSDVYAV